MIRPPIITTVGATSIFFFFLTRIRSFSHGFSYTASVSSIHRVRCKSSFEPRSSSSFTMLTSSMHHHHHHRSFALYAKKGDGTDKENSENEELSTVENENTQHPLSRRDIFAKTVATAAAATTAFANKKPAAADFTQPTRIELQVETDYLIKVLNYFDGDMRKALGTLVRSPFTKVQIDPPNAFFTADRDAAKDAILRALYTYDRPDDYIAQAKWLKIDDKKPSYLRSFVMWLTKKRFKVDIGGGGSQGEKEKMTISLSILETAVPAAVLSYPLAFAYYRYESYREQEEAKAKKAAIAAKKEAAAAKKKAAAKKSSVDTKKEEKGSDSKDDKPASKKKKEETPVVEKKKDESAKAAETKKDEPPAVETKKKDEASEVAIKKDLPRATEISSKQIEEQTIKEYFTKKDAPQDNPPPAATDAPNAPETKATVDVPATTLPPSAPPAKKGGANHGMDAYSAQYDAMLAAANKQKNSPPSET